ncbi:PQQ-binding-like beta-propeller repeat protein [Halorarum salinum]|uniref:PQQ-binding-like beta-propeller repeat protein n=1 Tax=Halorarum salinum TaxID=2743089 RepID=A0A7D5LDY5_9EURY|nr:PQQ-binding-like beta-propeller repeat protein [Halobaculum salinum]QLG63729.1 PQQ-binding-like beta-propeller repeat protein [Halobaculum salinum]
MSIRTRRTVLASLGALAGVSVAGQSLAADGTNEAGSDASEPSEQSLDWSTRRAGPGRTGSVPADAAPGGEYAAEAWTAGSGEFVFVEEPIVADGTVYRPFMIDDVSFRGGVVAFDAETGEERWRHVSAYYSQNDGWPTGIGRVNSAPTVAAGRLYLTSRAGTSDAEYGGLHALDAETGEVAWSETDRGWNGSPLYADGTLYVTAAPGEDVHALDPATGETRWRTDDSYSSGYVGFADDTLLGSRYPASGDADADPEVVGWNPDDGSIRWATTADEDVPVGGGAIEGDAVFSTVGATPDDEDRANEVVAWSPREGSVRWRTTLTPDGEDPEPLVSAPAVADGTVYVHVGPRTSRRDQHERSRDPLSTAYALDAATGEIEWTYDAPTVLLGDPSVAGDTVYVGGHAVQKKEKQGPSTIRRYPTVHALAAGDGSERWSYLLRAESDDVRMAMTPAVADGRVYAGIHDYGYEQSDGVFALEASDVAPDSANLPISSDAPVARIATDPEDAESRTLDGGTTVTLDGSASAGEVETYEWRVGESGSFEAGDPSIDVTLDFCGSIEVSLRVTGPDGGESTASATLSTVEG